MKQQQHLRNENHLPNKRVIGDDRTIGPVDERKTRSVIDTKRTISVVDPTIIIIPFLHSSSSSDMIHTMMICVVADVLRIQTIE